MTEDARGPATRDDDEDDFTPTPPTSDQLAWLRRRLSLNDRFLGYDLNRYQEMEAVSDTQLAAFFGTSPDQLNKLRLAGRPRPERYNADVREIARANGVSDFQLIKVLRAVQFDTAVAASPIAGRLLAAARDYDGEQSDHPTPAVAEDPDSYDERDANPDEPDAGRRDEDAPGTPSR